MPVACLSCLRRAFARGRMDGYTTAGILCQHSPPHAYESGCFGRSLLLPLLFGLSVPKILVISWRPCCTAAIRSCQMRRSDRPLLSPRSSIPPMHVIPVAFSSHHLCFLLSSKTKEGRKKEKSSILGPAVTSSHFGSRPTGRSVVLNPARSAACACAKAVLGACIAPSTRRSCSTALQLW